MAISELQKQTNTNIQEKANLIWEIATHLVGLFNSPCLDEFLGGQQALVAELLKHRQAEPVTLFPLKHAHVHH